jgi:hypothetical protein
MQLRFTFSVIIALTLISISGAMIAWRLMAPPSSMKREYLLLNEAGCLAARRFGLAVTPLESGQACELGAEAELEFNWVAIGPNRINRAHVIGTLYRNEKGSP